MSKMEAGRRPAKLRKFRLRPRTITPVTTMYATLGMNPPKKICETSEAFQAGVDPEW